MSIAIAARQAKAIVGTGAYPLGYESPLWAAEKKPQKLAKQAQALYHDHPWVHAAEKQVSGRGGAVEWHLEDDQDNEIEDGAGGPAGVLRDLLEKPQAMLPPNMRQAQAASRRSLWTVTLRHMGLCGTAFWYFDQIRDGVPLAILYINPARVYDVSDKAGNLQGWTLDAPVTEAGAVPITLDEMLPFYLDPPDWGHFGIGLVESVGSKAQLTTLADRHLSRVYASGGRLTGIISPKEANSVSDDQWLQFVRDYRTITEDPDAAKRLSIVKGPVDYTRMAATVSELEVVAVANMSRDDILALWGVPASQAGIATPAGLNSGAVKGFDEAILWQGAIHPRLRAFQETLQYGLLDRLPLKLDLELEEPEFDDDAPRYALLKNSENTALTNAERRELVGLPPFGDSNLDNAIVLPITLQPYAVAPGEGVVPSTNPSTSAPLEQSVSAKARSPRKPLINFRATVDRRIVPSVKRVVASFLAEQRAEIAAKVREKAAHLASKRKDTFVWWNAKKWDQKLADALKPHMVGITETVASQVEKVMPAPAKAGPDFTERVTQRVLMKGAGRVTGINETTRDSLAALLDGGLDEGLGAAELGDLIENATAFDEYRAELIARTESMFAYNDAALGSFGEYGVTQVEAIDGDGDEECAARDGQVFDLDEAESIEDHPNGTLDWVPVEAPAKSPLMTILDQQGRLIDAFANQSPPHIEVPVNVEQPSINVESPVVNFADIAESFRGSVNQLMERPIENHVTVDNSAVATALAELRVTLTRPKKLIRDEQGRIIGLEPE